MARQARQGNIVIVILCTQVISSLATINSFNQLTSVEWSDKQLYARLNNLKTV